MGKELKYIMLVLALVIVLLGHGQSLSSTEMQVHYVNVGQGSAALLEFPCGAILIDAGAQDDEASEHLITYLDEFFRRRADLKSTLELVIITHCHVDHNKALDQVAQKFRVNRYIDNGHHTGSGKSNQNWMQEACKEGGIKYRTYTNEQIISKGSGMGLSDAIIDPIKCAGVDPRITILSSSFETQPDEWSQTEFNNENNHSLIVRVEFGEASLLFLGDVQNKGIETVLMEYDALEDPAQGNALDADILLTSHHGAENGTTEELLNAVTPSYAIISCGVWNFGKDGTAGKFNTFYYGHPRISMLDLLGESVTTYRSKLTVKAATAAKKFKNYAVNKGIYATAWDGDIVFKVATDGQIFTPTGGGGNIGEEIAEDSPRESPSKSFIAKSNSNNNKKSVVMQTTSTPADILVIILLGAILGAVGQGARVIIGLKKLYDQALSANTPVSDLMEYKQLVLSMVIGFGVGAVAGVLAVVVADNPQFTKADILVYLGTGYAGTDFIEGFMKKYPSTAKPATNQPVFNS